MIKIAVDGLTGSGKGTLSDGIAERFNLRHLDTGAIFRGMGVSYLKSGITEPTEENIETELSKANISVVFENDKQQIYLNGENVTGSLREEAVSKLASKISALKHHKIHRADYYFFLKQFLCLFYAYLDINTCYNCM
jgi:cytidylate kinase